MSHKADERAHKASLKRAGKRIELAKPLLRSVNAFLIHVSEPFCSENVNPLIMKVTFLGTNGWYDTTTGNTCSVLIQSDEYDIILDAGNGIAKADNYITQEKPAYLFISHFHIDHIAGLHTLVKFRFPKGLEIIGQTGTAAILNTFVAEPFTVPLAQLPYHVRITELEAGEHSIPFPVECLPLVHPAPCYGYRLLLDGRIITYCTDTGVCDNAIALARNADLLITECGLKPGQASPGWPHLNPEDAIHIAKEAHAKRLALMHFGAEVYRTLDDRQMVQKQFENTYPGLVVATDDLTLDL
jgi:ribonuclease BN (tRNA processing enzyme)